MSTLPKWSRNAFRAVRGATFIVPWTLHLLLADILVSLLLLLAVVAPSLAYDLSSALAASVWRGVQFIFTRFNGAEITVVGAKDLPPGESAIVVANHVEWTDFFMIQELAISAGMLGRCRYFAKEQLKWVPFLGWGLWAMGMPLVSRKWMADQKEMDRVFYGIKERNWPVWLISYSEATRFTSTKRREAEEWCKANNRPLGDHLLYPRTKGFVASVKQLRQTEHVKAVYDITIAYAKDGKVFQASPTFVQAMSYPRLDKTWKFFVQVRRYELAKMPTGDAELAKWLETRWVEKGQLLSDLQKQLARGQPWTGDETDHRKSK